ncbi:TPA: hypothetical protein JBG74_05345 [Legionella pneumophila]|uniref:DUF4440 domain-containing protein n=1 Tax=Legionella pneumophila subsp. pneumophila (strain Philadelphia 1 / ATCC 33152 / DSM 7513) TaxID=272624 RepID=Q5ZSS1_LEGPH|nr:hypothetical protein [Legionella pneumophila]AAU28506.1 hypothetical protein lpg2445 [Legionella pneumophila subsp. pneumophila str. Philadelphia 1]AEW52681.1 hypothetical protein lp12_2437 [Legionella pneumophila subsp. pneumophila ATCC 43290]AGH52710.1 hypothetical protein LPE509_00619 [Legionella pneumophila subsp. pneumophila LPE509]AGN15364.1 hypothetical protein LP6_2474 [Legionella pneumophila subsp. pneumophila str. Thunder Bay]AOU05441.1 hypothetical protein A9E97_12290 [Legionella
MNRFIRFLLLLLITCSSGSPYLYAANKNNDFVLFEKIFTDWTLAFNQKKLAPTCALFSKSLIANYQGAPQKNYTSICHGFKKIFQQTRKNYQYHFKLKQVYRSGHLAVARITWYLQIFEQGKLISETQDEGLDVFLKDAQNQWKIINFIGYPVPGNLDEKH